MSNVNIDESALTAAVEIGKVLGGTNREEPIHFVVAQKDYQLLSLKDFQFPGGMRPERIKNNVALRSVGSFLNYVTAFRDDRTRVFADPGLMSFTAIIDYHGVGDERQVEFLCHRALFQIETEARWKIWFGKNEKPFTQNEFAEFIEDNDADIHDPSAAHMLEVARDLHASTEATFDSKVKLSNGQVQMKYTETMTGSVGTSALEIPEIFTIRVPVFYGGDPVNIKVRLRYRINGGKLTFFYKMFRSHEILQEAFQDAASSIAETLECQVLFGSVS